MIENITQLQERLKKWQGRFMGLALHIAEWSKDPSTKCGSIITNGDNVVLGMGYNGFPRNVDDKLDRYNDRPIKYKFIVHAEANAILNARSPVSYATLFSTKFPCSDCAKLIIQAGISEVYSPSVIDGEIWTADSDFSRQMLTEAGIIIGTIDND